MTEIRQFGASSTQVTRRLRPMLEDLTQLLPVHRSLALRQELDLLKSTIDHSVALPHDKMLAGVADSQGLGGTPKHLRITLAPRPSLGIETLNT
jgi:hypothetical protein